MNDTCACALFYRGGLLVTTSREWIGGGVGEVCVVSHGLATAVSVTVRLQQRQRRSRRRQQPNHDPVVYSQDSLVLPAGQ